MLETWSFRSLLDCTPEQLYAYHLRPDALQRLVPPWESVRILRGGHIGEGVVRWMLVGGVIPWQAIHDRFVPGVQFRDRQGLGPFLRWEHTHTFEPGPHAGSAWLTDKIRVSPPLMAGRFERMFRYRHWRTRLDLAGSARTSARILVTGSSGLLGTALRRLWEAQGHEILRFVRRTPQRPDEVSWDELERLSGLSCVVHLAGASVDGPWDAPHLRAMWDSRVDFTRRLVNALNRLPDRPPLLSASGANYFGAGPVHVEGDPPGEDFLARLAVAWEDEAARYRGRVVMLRFGAVLTPAAGVLRHLLLPWSLGLGCIAGSGRQGVPWIALEDAVRLVDWCAWNDLEGPVNAVGPQPVDFRTFARTLARVLRRPLWLRLPAPVMRVLLGRRATLVLKGPLVKSRRLDQFCFLGPDLEQALRLELGLLDPPGFRFTRARGEAAP